ncbi:type IV secretion system protein [Lysobacter sp. CA199]|uniref:type IV secretion system protein n=1 Tax=Lysobacter sp. CA199 TaxID=3455608 RepID=UPI003F8D3BD2
MDLFSASSNILGWLSPSIDSGVADYAIFRIVNGWLTSRIADFGLALMGRSMGFVGGVGLCFVTLWVFFQGYQVLTGKLRDPLMGLVVSGLRIVLCFGIATSMALGGVKLHDFLTTDMDEAIHEIVTGKKGQTTADSIDENLAYLQIAMTAIDGIQVLDGNPELVEEKRTAKLLAGLGAAGPALAAGVMLLLMKFVVAMWVGFGPLFIFALAFDATKGMFHRWLQYGLGTLFSMAMLSFVSNLILDLMIRVSAAMWLAKLVNIPGMSAEGISSQAMQQGGLGLVLTMLIISVPPVAAHFFQGQVGSFLQFSAFNNSNQSQPGPQGQPPGSYSQGDRVSPPREGNTGRTFDAGARHMPTGQPDSQNNNEIKKR